MSSERGAELIEMVVVTPLLLLLLFGIIDFGFMFQRYVVLTNAAMEGARVGILPGYSANDAQTRATTYAATGGVPGTVNAVATTVNLPGAGGGTWPGVRVTALCPGPTKTEFGDVAGFKANGAFDKISARSEDVVAMGLKALDEGKAVAIPGLLNKAGAQAYRLMPRALLRRIAGSLKL